MTRHTALVLFCFQPLLAQTWTKNNDQTASGSGPVAVTFTNSLHNPSVIVFACKDVAAAVSWQTPTDTAGHTYVDSGNGNLTFNSGAADVQMWYALNTSTTSGNVITQPASGSYRCVGVEFYVSSGTISTDKIASQTNQNSGTAGGQNVSSTATSALSTAADLAIGVGTVITGTMTAGTGFTATSHPMMEYQALSATTGLAATWSDSANSDPYAAMITTFKATSSSSVVRHRAMVIQQ